MNADGLICEIGGICVRFCCLMTINLFMQRVAGVAVILLNARQQVLLQLRDNRTGLPFANCWTLPGGKVEVGETPEAAAHREIREELGVDLPLTAWQTYERPGNAFLIEQHVFIGRTELDVADMALGEGQALCFFDENALTDLSIGFGFAELLAEFFHGKSV
jgi:8-oxo-dGTP diphosphatase